MINAIVSAIQGKDISQVKDFMKKKDCSQANLNNANRWGVTPLAQAIDVGDLAIVKYLIEHGAEVNKSSTCQIFRERPNRGTGNVLNDYLSTENPVFKFTPLEIAALKVSGEEDKNAENIVKYLIEQKPNLSDQKNVKDNTDECDSKWNKDAASNVNVFSALNFACASGNINVVKMLIDAGANVNYNYGCSASPLSIAAEHNQLEIIALLLKNGAEIDLELLDNSGRKVGTALHQAVKAGAAKSVACLLDENADPNALTLEKETPLHLLAGLCDQRIDSSEIEDIASKLIGRGADPFALLERSNKRYTPRDLILCDCDEDNKVAIDIAKILRTVEQRKTYCAISLVNKASRDLTRAIPRSTPGEGIFNSDSNNKRPKLLPEIESLIVEFAVGGNVNSFFKHTKLASTQAKTAASRIIPPNNNPFLISNMK